MNTPTSPPPPFPPPPPPPPAAQPPQYPSMGVLPPPPDRPTGSTGSGFTESLFANAEAILKWTGVLLVALSAIFGVSKGIDDGLIGPSLQLAGAALIGLAFIGLGLWIDKDRPGWSHALAIVGIGTLFLTSAATNWLVDPVPPPVTLAALAAVFLMSLGIAVFLRRQWIACTSTVWFALAALAQPLDQFSAGGIGIGIAAFALVGIVVATHQQWKGLQDTTLVTGMILLLLHAAFVTAWSDWSLGFDQDLDLMNRVNIGVAAALLALLAWVPAVPAALVRPFTERRIEPLESRLRMVVPVWLWSVISTVANIDDPYQQLQLALGLGVLFLCSAIPMTIKSSDGDQLAETVFGITIMTLVSLAMPIDLSAARVGIALIVAVLALTWKSTESPLVAIEAVVLGFIVAALTLISLNDAWAVDAPLSTDLANLSVIVSAGFIGWILRDDEVGLLAAWTSLAGLLVWIPTVLLHIENGVALISVAWAAIGFLLVGYGAKRFKDPIVVVGLALLGVVLAKLFFVDLEHVDTLVRAATFSLIGICLLRLGYAIPAWMIRREEFAASKGNEL